VSECDAGGNLQLSLLIGDDLHTARLGDEEGESRRVGGRRCETLATKQEKSRGLWRCVVHSMGQAIWRSGPIVTTRKRSPIVQPYANARVRGAEVDTDCMLTHLAPFIIHRVLLPVVRYLEGGKYDGGGGISALGSGESQSAIVGEHKSKCIIVRVARRFG
jgi:hypothetical protein